MISWRTAAIVLAMLCAVQRWQSCTRSEPRAASSRSGERGDPDAPRERLPQAVLHAFAPDGPDATRGSDATAKPTRTFFGMRIPAWAQRLLPQPGEKMRDYRDRILPLAELAVAPQRVRVARMREGFDEHQLAALDAATADAAKQIEARVASAIANGELQTVKPMTGVTMARELLDIVDRGNSRFVGSLTPEQQTQLAASHFDFADYLVFSTHWEDALAGR